MDLDRYCSELKALNYYEKIGKEYTLAHNGTELSWIQYVMLTKYRGLENLPQYILTPTAQAEEEVFLQEYRKNYGVGILSAQQYIAEGRNVEIEKLLRYIHIPAHKHGFFEFVCVLSGECNHRVGDAVFPHRTGDFTIIPPGIRHELWASEDCVCITIKMREEAFADAFQEILRGNSVLSAYFNLVQNTLSYRYSITLHSGEDRFFRDTLLNMYWQQTNNSLHCDFITQSLMQAMFGYLMQNFQDTAEYHVSDAIQHKKISEVLMYIYENYQDITLAETARHFSLNPSYLSTRISTLTGQSFTDIVRGFRMKRAAELLRKTDRQLDVVCEEVGYADPAQFIRTFKKVYGVTPGQYRKGLEPISCKTNNS